MKIDYLFSVGLAFRDVALQCIRKMVKNQLDMDRYQINDDVTDEQWVAHSMEQRELVDAISYLVRLSPPCPVLHQELWCIPLGPTWFRSSLIYHVSKWLESFPDLPMELIAFWQQAGRFDSEAPYIQGFEYEWRQVAKRWNSTIGDLDLPDDLKLPLPI
ncbi:hypothetical protein B0H14DRAFT_782050 [Mycena olivaceomarginata]|nr:hypothetical protein B0H14DRAFT_782050 [Mycena olivaceomarginata]